MAFVATYPDLQMYPIFVNDIQSILKIFSRKILSFLAGIIGSDQCGKFQPHQTAIDRSSLFTIQRYALPT